MGAGRQMIEACLYRGTVTHRRLRPVSHMLNYTVTALLIDVDKIAETVRQHRLLSYNCFNIFALDDRDHGKGDGTTIRDFAWSLVKSKTGTDDVQQIFMLCYPRLLGFVFNPITTYFCVDNAHRIRLMIYEVHNTFGGRHNYVTEAIDVDEPNYFETAKKFYVSPFNKIEGHYGLKASSPLERVSVGVALTTQDGPLLNAYFAGHRVALNDGNLLRVFFSYPLMTLKVVAAIHFEALKLWLKGLKVQS
jgi:uncharacterized protein